MAVIAIKIKGGDRIPFENIKEFQGELKTHNQEKIENLKKSILEEGFIAPIVIWEWKDFILDGHQRQKALKGLIEDGHELEGGEVPVIKIIADSLPDARKILLKYNTEYTDGFNFLELQDFSKDVDMAFLENPQFDKIRLDIHEEKIDDIKKDFFNEKIKTDIIIKKWDTFKLWVQELKCNWDIEEIKAILLNFNKITWKKIKCLNREIIDFDLFFS